MEIFFWKQFGIFLIVKSKELKKLEKKTFANFAVKFYNQLLNHNLLNTI